MYFSPRLWSLTAGVRGRIALAVALGLATAAAGIARLVLLGVLLARVFEGDGPADLALPNHGRPRGDRYSRIPPVPEGGRCLRDRRTRAIQAPRAPPRPCARAGSRLLRFAAHRRRHDLAGRGRRATRDLLRAIPAAVLHRRARSHRHLRLHGVPRPADRDDLPRGRARDAGRAGRLPPHERGGGASGDERPTARSPPTSSTRSRDYRRSRRSGRAAHAGTPSSAGPTPSSVRRWACSRATPRPTG